MNTMTATMQSNLVPETQELVERRYRVVPETQLDALEMTNPLVVIDERNFSGGNEYSVDWTTLRTHFQTTCPAPLLHVVSATPSQATYSQLQLAGYSVTASRDLSAASLTESDRFFVNSLEKLLGQTPKGSFDAVVIGTSDIRMAVRTARMVHSRFRNVIVFVLANAASNLRQPYYEYPELFHPVFAERDVLAPKPVERKGLLSGLSAAVQSLF